MGGAEKSVVACILLSFAVLAPLQGSELSFFIQNARSAAMGGAFVAKADDVFGLYENPAGLAFLHGLRFEAGSLFNRRTTTATATGSGQRIASNPFQFWGTAAFSWQPRTWVTLGLGFFTPYSARFVWPSMWAGESLAIEMGISAQYFRPAVAFRLPGNLAVGAGLDLVFSDIVWSHEMTTTLPNFPNLKTIDYESRHEMSGHGLGFTAGLLWKPLRFFQIGAKYQHRVAIDYQGSNVFTSRTGAAPLMPHPEFVTFYFYQFFRFFYKRQDVTSRLTLPRELAGGILLSPLPNLSLTFDAEWTAWHELGSWEFRSVNSDENLNPEFTSLHAEFYGTWPDYGRQSAGLVLQDAWKYEAGVEYGLFGRFALRGGFAVHESSVKAVDLNPAYPDLDRTFVSLGFGYEGPFFSIWDRKELGAICADVFFQYAWAKTKTASPPAIELTYGGNRWVFGLSVGVIL